MKKTLKRVLLVLIPILLVVAGVALYALYPMLVMQPVETGAVFGTEIYAVKNNRNDLFLLKTEEGYLLVDAGSDAEQVAASLRAIGIGADTVKWIFLTHSDYDHVAALTLFPQAEIYMGEDELNLLNGTAKRNASGGNKLPDGVRLDAIQLLTDGQMLSCGGTNMICIKAPGHTEGSMVYLADEKYLFTGDAFRVNGNKLEPHPFTMDKTRAGETLERLKDICNSSSVVLTSHYGCYENPEFE